eukprot:g3030.t1
MASAIEDDAPKVPVPGASGTGGGQGSSPSGRQSPLGNAEKFAMLLESSGPSPRSSRRQSMPPSTSNFDGFGEISPAPVSPTPSKRDIKNLVKLRRGSLQPMMKSPNTMVATEPGHYMPEVDTPFAKAVNLTIDAGFEKDKGRRRRRLITRKYKARLKTEKEELKSQKKKALRRDRREKKGKEVRTKDVIGKEDEMYALTYGMMIGVQVSVGRQFSEAYPPTAAARKDSTTSVDSDSVGADGISALSSHSSRVINLNSLSRRLTMKDFMAVEKYIFPLSPSMSAGTAVKKGVSFKFKDYAPLCFRHLRNLWKVDPAEYLLSICGNLGFIKFLSNSKSGQYFFFSNDMKYMIKTLTDQECKFLRRILPYFVEHMGQYPDSLLNRYYGLHRVKMPHIRRRLHFVVMNNIFNTPKDIHVKYDIKGATYKGRYTSHEKIKKKPGSVRKDLNFLGFDDSLSGPIENLAQRIKLGTPERRKKFIDQIRVDSLFLSKMGIMDYSLLVGIHGRVPEKIPGYGVGKKPPRKSSRGSSTSGNTSGGEMSDGKASSGDESMMSDGLEESYNLTADELEESEIIREPECHQRLPIFNQESGGYQGKTPSGENNNEIYYFGIIDILQQYNLIKRGENIFKTYIAGQGKGKISSVPPLEYAKRFIKFFSDTTDPQLSE